MKKIGIIIGALMVMALGLLTNSAWAKGPQVDGLFVAKNVFGEGNDLEIEFALVNVPSSTTLIANCNFDSYCELGQREKALCPLRGNEPCTFINDFVITDLLFSPTDNISWQIDYARPNTNGDLQYVFSLRVLRDGHLEIVLPKGAIFTLERLRSPKG